MWNSDQGYDSTLKAFDASLERLGLEYVDLYLIHWQSLQRDKYVDTWKAFEQLYADKPGARDRRVELPRAGTCGGCSRRPRSARR